MFSCTDEQAFFGGEEESIGPKACILSILRAIDHLPTQKAVVIFLRFYLFIFRERGREGEREGEKYQCVFTSHGFPHPPPGTRPATQACVPIGNRTSDPLVLRPALNPPSHTSQVRLYQFLFLPIVDENWTRSLGEIRIFKFLAIIYV